jgi:putative two-component system response regulator
MFKPPAILGARVLLVDDKGVNLQLLEQTLARAGYTSVTSTTNPREVCELHRRNNFDLILLDLLMPDMDGFQVLEGLKAIDSDGYLPVLVVTAQPGHKLRALQAGAKDFVSKPFEIPEVLARVHNILEARMLQKELHNTNEVLEQRVRERTEELREGYLETIHTMTRAAEHKDLDTGVHVQRISYHCRALAKGLGLSDTLVDEIFFASPMHDIGKIGVPDHLLLKPGDLTPEEWDVMKGHCAAGAQILGDSRSPFLRTGAQIALSHHERWDGSGYPNGIRGEAIPLAARIVNLCDVYDALRSRRPYKPAFDHRTTMEVITHGDGRTQPEHFDPAILAVFQQYHESFRAIFEQTLT